MFNLGSLRNLEYGIGQDAIHALGLESQGALQESLTEINQMLNSEGMLLSKLLENKYFFWCYEVTPWFRTLLRWWRWHCGPP